MIVDETAIFVRPEIGHDLILGVCSQEFNNSDDIQHADKILVILLRSLVSKKRHVVGYFYTKNVNGAQLYQVLKDIIIKIENETRFRIHAISSDMGPCNRGAWESFGISVLSKGVRKNIGQHLLNASETPRSLFWFPDSSHLLKNIRNFMTTHSYVLPKFFCIQHDLRPLSIASLAPVEAMIAIRERGGPNFQPKLRQDVIIPSGFNKMNVGYVVRFFCPETVIALKRFQEFTKVHQDFVVNCSQDVIDSVICFIELVSDWFQLVSAPIWILKIVSVIHFRLSGNRNSR